MEQRWLALGLIILIGIVKRGYQIEVIPFEVFCLVVFALVPIVIGLWPAGHRTTKVHVAMAVLTFNLVISASYNWIFLA